MKNIVLGILLLFVSLSFAQEGVDGKTWIEGYEKAAKLSQQTGKPILANFTGSDWCGWCVKLDREVFSKKEFEKWAKEHVILLKVDFPKRKKLPVELASSNSVLARTFGVRGYPTIWAFSVGKDSTEITPLAKTSYVKGGPDRWIASIAPKLAIKK